MSHKPHLGKIRDWKFEKDAEGIEYIVGFSLGHPHYAGRYFHTSRVLNHDKETGEIETLNSRYTLIGNGGIGKDLPPLPKEVNLAEDALAVVGILSKNEAIVKLLRAMALGSRHIEDGTNQILIIAAGMIADARKAAGIKF